MENKSHLIIFLYGTFVPVQIAMGFGFLFLPPFTLEHLLQVAEVSLRIHWALFLVTLNISSEQVKVLCAKPPH